MKNINTLLRLYVFSCVTALFSLFFSGCGILNPAVKDGNGYHVAHLSSCGPTAMEEAINEYYRRQGVIFTKWPAPREEISKGIQDDGQLFKKALSLFDKEVVCVTWSWEMKSAAKKYGFELVSVKDFEKLDPAKDIALVLVYGKFFSSQWHWMCYPVNENIEDFFGSKTKIDKIYLLKKK
jgi:hypothetical protein